MLFINYRVSFWFIRRRFYIGRDIVTHVDKASPWISQSDEWKTHSGLWSSRKHSIWCYYCIMAIVSDWLKKTNVKLDEDYLYLDSYLSILNLRDSTHQLASVSFWKLLYQGLLDNLLFASLIGTSSATLVVQVFVQTWIRRERHCDGFGSLGCMCLILGFRQLMSLLKPCWAQFDVLWRMEVRSWQMEENIKAEVMGDVKKKGRQRWFQVWWFVLKYWLWFWNLVVAGIQSRGFLIITIIVKDKSSAVITPNWILYLEHKQRDKHKGNALIQSMGARYAR